MTSPKIILGSSSKWRKDVLTKMGYQFTTMSPDIDEKAIRHPDAKQLTLMISRAKAEALIPKVKEASILITSDQVIVCNGQIREKPKDKEECRTSYKQHPAECVTSVVVINTQTNKRSEGTDVAVQHFNEIPEEAIDNLIEQGDVLYCAGGFAIELMEQYLKKLEGEIESVIGLPKTLTKKLIEEVM